MRGRPTPTSGGLGENARGCETSIQAPCAYALFRSAFAAEIPLEHAQRQPRKRTAQQGGRRATTWPRTTSPPRWTASGLQVKPLYDALHAFTRNGLERAYGARGAAPDGRIPAHLLGNMWSRDGLEAGHLYVVRDPLRRDRLQHLYLSVGMRRPKMLDVS
jgi:hypothetical protein